LRDVDIREAVAGDECFHVEQGRAEARASCSCYVLSSLNSSICWGGLEGRLGWDYPGCSSDAFEMILYHDHTNTTPPLATDTAYTFTGYLFYYTDVVPRDRLPNDADWL
jgi:hypothetical protein